VVSAPTNETKTVNPGNGGSHEPIRVSENSKRIGDLYLQIESLRFVNDSSGRAILSATLFFKNMSDKKSLGITLAKSNRLWSPPNTSVQNNKGDEFLIASSTLSG